MSYAAINMDALKQEAEALKDSGGNGGGFQNEGDIVNSPFKKVGSNYMWLLPPWREGVLFSKLTSTHWSIPVGFDNATNQLKKVVRSCTATNSPHGRCPICDIILNARGMCEDEFINDFTRRDKYCVNAIKLELNEDGFLYPERQRPYVYKLPPSVRKLIIEEMSKPNIMDVTDPFNGLPLEIVRPESFQGKGAYKVNIFAGYPRGPIPTPLELTDNLEAQQKWIEDSLKQIHDLDNIFRVVVNDKYKELIDTAQELIDYLSEYQNVEIDPSILDFYKDGDFWKDDSKPPMEAKKEEAPKAETTKTEAPKEEKPAPKSEVVKEAIESEAWDKPKKPKKAKSSDTSGALIEIGGKEYCIEGIVNNVLHLENEDGETRYACRICKDKVWKREVFAEKHCMSEHGDEPITLKTRDTESEDVTESINETTAEEEPVAKTTAPASDSDFITENEDGSLTYVDTSGISLKIKQKCFGSYEDDEKCNPKMRKICIHKPKCQEARDRMAK